MTRSTVNKPEEEMRQCYKSRTLRQQVDPNRLTSDQRNAIPKCACANSLLKILQAVMLTAAPRLKSCDLKQSVKVVQ